MKTEPKPKYGYQLFEPNELKDVPGTALAWVKIDGECDWHSVDCWGGRFILGPVLGCVPLCKPVEIPGGWELVPLSDGLIEMGWDALLDKDKRCTITDPKEGATVRLAWKLFGIIYIRKIPTQEPEIVVEQEWPSIEGWKIISQTDDVVVYGRKK